ncbi:ERF family protein [Oscillibacter sp.]|uniref:ERF family protein n=1 Tax=Oscillibacter sp. TaxID=1945593 RepID=UPI00289F6538|nr:ERF family protein [Oscillibacter sp.]
MNIYEKITAIMQDVQYLAKDDKVSFGTTNYKALSEEKVTSIMRAELLKYGLVVFPIEQVANRTGSITHVDVKYRLLNVEQPDEFIDIVSCGDGADTQDKGSGKAMTYAYKYMWLRTFALPTGEDPDKISSAELDDKAAKAKKEEEPVLCEECGKPIKDAKNNSGEVWKAKDIAVYTALKFKRKLCIKCMNAAQKNDAI